MICNVFPHTLSRLLLALCPNVTSSNFPSIQFPVIIIFILAFTPFIWFCYQYALLCWLQVVFLFCSSASFPSRWYPICCCPITTSTTLWLWDDYLRSQCWKSKCCRKWVACWQQQSRTKASAKSFKHQAVPNVPEAYHKTREVEEAQSMGLLWLRCKTQKKKNLFCFRVQIGIFLNGRVQIVVSIL